MLNTECQRHRGLRILVHRRIFTSMAEYHDLGQTKLSGPNARRRKDRLLRNVQREMSTFPPPIPSLLAC